MDANEFGDLGDSERANYVQRFLKTGAPSSHRAALPSFAPKNDRRGTKKGTRLSRAPTEGLPISSQDPDRSLSHVNGPTSAPESISYWENNADFVLEFCSPKSSRCAACCCPIAYLAAVPGQRLVLRHAEQFVYPTGPVGASRWNTTAVSTYRKRNFYYHAKSVCISKRFSMQYFNAMPIRLGSGVRDELSRFPLDIRHKDL